MNTSQHQILNFLFFCIAGIMIPLGSAQAQSTTLSGRITGQTLNASIRVKQGTSTTFVPVDSNGNWSFNLPQNVPYEVQAFTSRPGTRVSPPARGGAPATTAGLDFHIAEGFEYKQIFGRVTMNGTGVGGVIITSNKASFGSTVTSNGANGELPAGMYVFDYTRFSTIGSVRFTPSKSGIMSFSPTSRGVNADQGQANVDFEIPTGTAPPAPNPQPTPAPSAPTHQITGFVKDSAGNPLAGVQIFGGPELGNTTTDTNGQYGYSNVREGAYLGFAPVYSPHAFSPQSAVFQNGITGDITQNFVGVPLYGPPIFSVEPLDQRVNQYYPANFRVQVINPQGGVPTYQWYKDGQPIGTNSNVLSFNAQKADKGATIQCRVTNAYGSVWTRVATLSLNTTPDIIAEPVDVTVRSGEPASFSVQATGGSMTYLWLTGNVNWPNNTGNMLVITPVLQADGTVTINGANVFNPALPVSNTISLWVYVRNQYGGTLSREVSLTVLAPTSGNGTGSTGGGAGGGNTTGGGTGQGGSGGIAPGTPGNPVIPGNPGTFPTPVVDTYDTLLNDAVFAAAQPFPRGKKNLKAFAKLARRLLGQLKSADAALEQSLFQIDGMRATLDEAAYRSVRQDVIDAITLINSTKTSLSKKAKRVKAKLRRMKGRR